MTIKNQGFTLYELLITMVLIALISSLAVPSLAASMARQRQRVEIDALFHAIHQARKESIMRRKVVSLCPSLDGKGQGLQPQSRLVDRLADVRKLRS